MESINTVDYLITALKEKKAEESYMDIMERMDIPLREFERYYSWNDDRYSRNCLIKTDDFELLLICYEKGQKTPIHDFDSHEAWIHTIHGKLREERFRIASNGKQLKKLSSTTLGTSDYSFMSKIGIHRYTNIYESRSVSLNLYIKPIEEWTQYDEEANASKVKVKHDSVYV